MHTCANSVSTTQHVLLCAVTTTEPGAAFTTSDLETNCVRLLETGLFKSVRPKLVRPGAFDCPQFVRVTGDRIASVPPLGPVEYVVTPRVLPKPLSFSVRIDSSLNREGKGGTEGPISQMFPLKRLRYKSS